MISCHSYPSIGRRRTLVVRMVSLVCADIADSFIFFVANALVCIFNECRAACVLTRCKLNNAVEIVLRSPLSTESGPSNGRAGGSWSRVLLSKSYAAAVDFTDPGLEATELGLVA